ncbi:DMT family transporter [Alphaproteobacteria bacterium]|nr:DMT family transporter [Alphaproteobacteria bacterium]
MTIAGRRWQIASPVTLKPTDESASPFMLKKLNLPAPSAGGSSPFSGPLAAWSRIPANIRGASFVITGGFLLIVMASLVKLLGQTLPVFEVLFIRFLAGLVVILPLVWRMGLDITYTKKIHLHATRGFVGFIGNLFFFFALIHIPLADTVTIQFSRPLFMIVIAGLFLGEIVGLKRSVTTLIGFGGVLMITQPFSEGFDPWALSALGGALFGTLVVLTVKLLSRTEHIVTIMFYFAIFTTAFAFVPAMVTWQDPTWIELGLLILTGVLGIVGQGMFSHGVGLGETSFVMPFDYMRIVYGFVLGIIWFAEIPGIWSFAGASVIIGTSIFLLRTENRKKVLEKTEEAGDEGAPKA